MKILRWKLTTIDHAVMMAPSGMEPTTPAITIKQDPVEYVRAADHDASVEKLEKALRDLLSHCDVKPEGETAFEKAVIRARALVDSQSDTGAVEP
jgi:hypothetical protein